MDVRLLVSYTLSRHTYATKSGPGTSSCKPVDTQLEQPCNVPAQRCHGAPHVAPGASRRASPRQRTWPCTMVATRRSSASGKAAPEKPPRPPPAVTQPGFWRSFATRAKAALAMMVCFLCILWAGHFYVWLLILMLQVLSFRELLNVRYQDYKKDTEKAMPCFVPYNGAGSTRPSFMFMRTLCMSLPSRTTRSINSRSPSRGTGRRSRSSYIVWFSPYRSTRCGWMLSDIKSVN